MTEAAIVIKRMERTQRLSDLSIDAQPLSIEKLFADFYAVPDFQKNPGGQPFIYDIQRDFYHSGIFWHPATWFVESFDWSLGSAFGRANSILSRARWSNFVADFGCVAPNGGKTPAPDGTGQVQARTRCPGLSA
jgi:hypothetical protein